jgi:hypothetical protein
MVPTRPGLQGCLSALRVSCIVLREEGLCRCWTHQQLWAKLVGNGKQRALGPWSCTGVAYSFRAPALLHRRHQIQARDRALTPRSTLSHRSHLVETRFPPKLWGRGCSNDRVGLVCVRAGTGDGMQRNVEYAIGAGAGGRTYGTHWCKSFSVIGCDVEQNEPAQSREQASDSCHMFGSHVRP